MALTCSIVVPVYNSEGTLEELVARLGKVMPQLCKDFEVILINDGSGDRSWQVICELAKQYPWTRGINMMRNYGQHNALLCGLRAAKYEITVTMDDDLQHPPEEIGILLSKLSDDIDVVYGLPKKLPHSFWRNLFSLLTKRLLAFVMGIPTVRYAGSFRALRTELRNAFATFQSPNVILDVLLSWGTTRFATIEVDEAPRKVGNSNYNFVKLFSHAMLILTGFSTAPLRLASMIGFAFTILGIIIFAYVIILFFIAGSIPGFPFLASIIALFSGTQLFALGIFGEYLATVFDRSMERPVYMIRETTGKDETQ
jgi:undecaprenyl-phosphate 4-deoxy-4-formamido-L-arabinose transferase